VLGLVAVLDPVLEELSEQDGLMETLGNALVVADGDLVLE